MRQITHASTFSGIGAAEIAAEMLGWRNLFHCEINPFGRQILDFYFPDAESYEDITKTDFSKWAGQVDVLTGGFPCQPFSYAGKRRGSEDDRYLWPFMLKCIQQTRPTWFIGENVGGLATMVFPSEATKVGNIPNLFTEEDIMERNERYVLDSICSELERAGYTVQPLLIPAAAVGAPHRRDRIFIIAHADNATRTGGRCADTREDEGEGSKEPIQERDQVQQSGEPDNVRPEMRQTPTDTDSDRGGAYQESERTQGNRSDGHAEQSERRQQTERTDGLSEVSRPITDTNLQRPEKRYVPDISNKEKRLATKENTDRRNTKSDIISSPDPKGRRSGDLREQSETQRPRISDELLRDRSRLYGDHMLPENRWRAFPTQSPVCRRNDGLPFDVDNLSIPFSRWKNESLKAYGNAIVVQVLYEIFRAIEQTENEPKTSE